MSGYQPKPCTFCGAPVEAIPGTRPGELDRVPDRRMPRNAILIYPPVCWECRGGVIMQLPREEGPWTPPQ